jgi:hypothetical protein
MSKLDELLAQIQREKVVKEPEVVVKEVVVKKTFPWITIVLCTVILVMGYFIWSGNIKKDNIVVNNVAEEVEKYENLYSTYKGQTYLKLAELVKNKQINNSVQLLKNAQAILEKAREESLGKLDEMDNKMIPDVFEEKRESVVKYLEDKATGFERAGK